MKIENHTTQTSIGPKIMRGLEAVALKVNTTRKLAKEYGFTPHADAYKGSVEEFENAFKGLTVKITDEALELHTAIRDNRTPTARFKDYEFFDAEAKKKVKEDGKTHTAPRLVLDLDMACPVTIYLHSESGKPLTPVYDRKSVANALIDAAQAILNDMAKAEAEAMEENKG